MRHAYLLERLEAAKIPMPLAELMADTLASLQTGNNRFGLDMLIDSAIDLYADEGDNALVILESKLAKIEKELK